MMIEISLEQYNDMASRLAELEWRLGEAVQVVRCKECRHAEHRKQMKKQVYCKRDKLATFCVVHDDDDFCKYGERREP